MLTKKDYAVIAKIIDDNTLSMAPTLLIRDQLIESLGVYFKADNPNFDIEKFVKACK